MRFTDTTKPDRKSGGSRGTCSVRDIDFEARTLDLNKFVIPTGAKRSGGTCCFYSSPSSGLRAK